MPLMISFDEATAVIRAIALPLDPETVPVDSALWRILAEPVVARVTSPSTDTSAMDGYAVRNLDVQTTPVSLQVIGKSFAGSGYGSGVGQGQAVRIFTGAPIPTGADRVIMQELVTQVGTTATLNLPPGSGWHIRDAGSDFRKGDQLLPANISLNPRALLVCAAADYAQVRVWRKPKLVILSTGDELVPSGTATQFPGHIPDSVSIGVAALTEQWGGQMVYRQCIADELTLLKAAAAEALTAADVIIVTGGASVGERDYAKTMFEDTGLNLLFNKVAIKPGKPVWMGTVGSTFIIGLPGNPTSAMVTARLFLAPLLAALTGAGYATAQRWRSIGLGMPLGKTGERETFVRAKEEGGLAHPFNNQDSSAQKTLFLSNLLIHCPATQGHKATGDLVEVLDF